MKRRMPLMAIIGVICGFALSGLAQAQAPAAAPGGAAPTGQVDNTSSATSGTSAPAVDSTTTTTTETTTTETTPANTGGEPLLMVLAGSLTTCGALWMRRKLA